MSRARLLGFLVRAVVAFGLLGLAIGMNRREIRDVLADRPDPIGFVKALGFYLAGLLFSYYRWYLLVRAVGLRFRYRDAVRLGFIGALFDFVIPGAVFGNVVKAAFLCRERPEDKPKAIGSVIVNFLAGLIGLFLIAALVGTIGRSQLAPGVRKLVVAAWIAVALSTLALGVAIRRRRAGAYRDHLGLVALAILMGTGTHSLNVLAFFQTSIALFGASSVPGLAEHFLIVPLVLFTTAVPLPFGALGVSEQASKGLFGLMHYDSGAVAMLGFRVVMIAGAAIGAVVYLLNAKEVRELAVTDGAEL
jgi:glycosyltransferase 2 family protein